MDLTILLHGIIMGMIVYDHEKTYIILPIIEIVLTLYLLYEIMQITILGIQRDTQ